MSVMTGSGWDEAVEKFGAKNWAELVMVMKIGGVPRTAH
jgi:hypothetical protein